jgi:lipopolysaccharide/colanic/teichoic acid biosynthesis glycosyltransferase
VRTWDDMAHFSGIEAGIGYGGTGAADRVPAGDLAATDRGLALVLLVALAPLMAAIALAIRLDSPGPVLHRRPEDPGPDDRRPDDLGPAAFVTRFRTVRTGAGDGVPARVTAVGRILRETGLDALPRLWDVLCGRAPLAQLNGAAERGC